MGTNFYTLGDKHIGKRSAAGLYCWDCGITLCRDGVGGIHQSRSEWLDHCPKCRTTRLNEGWNSSAGRELGFNNAPFKKKSGVASCSSFSWAMPEKDLWDNKRIKVIKDEYGHRFTIAKFKKVLQECPIQRHDSIGMEFS